MASFNIGVATTTNIRGAVEDFIVNSKALDVASPNLDEYFWYHDKATQNFGYYFQIPEIFSAANALATWAFGMGYETKDTNLIQELEHVTGNGKDTFESIMWNHEVTKLIVGDAFIHVPRKDGKIINMIPISPERVRTVYTKQNRIKRYDTWNGTEWKAIPKEEMLHSFNKRVGDQCHGTSQIDACKWVIDARNEALVDGRMIQNRGKALGIAYYKTDNAGKIAYANTQIEKAVKNGEMVGLPEGTVEIREFPTKNIVDRMSWIAYLENFFYQVFGVPRSIVSSDGTSEVGGKMGHVIFEVIYAKEQRDEENNLWNQQAIDVTFNRPQSLGGLVNQEEQKNSGQLNMQPNDSVVNLNRE